MCSSIIYTLAMNTSIKINFILVDQTCCPSLRMMSQLDIDCSAYPAFWHSFFRSSTAPFLTQSTYAHVRSLVFCRKMKFTTWQSLAELMRFPIFDSPSSSMVVSVRISWYLVHHHNWFSIKRAFHDYLHYDYFRLEMFEYVGWINKNFNLKCHFIGLISNDLIWS